MPNLKQGDGSGRSYWPLQVNTLSRLEETWNDPIHALILPTGSGKSMIARSIQRATDADILTVSNPLVNQYSGEYPDLNSLKGKTHYNCKMGISCKDWQDCGFDSCGGCPYTIAKGRAAAGEPTFFNPMSYYYFKLSSGAKGNGTLIVDEAHQLPGMVLLLCGKRFKRSEYAFSEKCCNELYFVKWAKDQLKRLDSLCALYYKRNEIERLSKCKNEIESLSLVLEGIEERPENYVIYIAKEGREVYLTVRPIFPPQFLMDRIVGGKKLVIMSGTLFEHDIKMIGGERAATVIEQNSSIPRKNREIHWKAAPFAVNYRTDPTELVKYIEGFLEKGVNTLIHSTYSNSKRLAPLFKLPVIFNTSEDKEEKIAEFRSKGGIFLASGCAEGIDFRGDVCRLNIIPKLSFPDLKDPAVIKRKAMQDGDRWYALETLKTTIQQAGRSTRGVDDHSKIIVLDPNFGPLVKRYWKYLPRYFTESIVGL